MAPLIAGVMSLVNTAADRLIPDKGQAAKFQQELQKLLIKNEQKLMVGQMEINKEEAKHKSVFVAGWRPAVGWICAFSVGWHFILSPMIAWVAVLNGSEITPPALDTGPLMTLLLGMLGIGGMRSWEKFKGIETKKVRE